MILTSRERQIAELVRCGYTNSEISEETGISEGTVRRHLENIYAKLDFQNNGLPRVNLAVWVVHMNEMNAAK